MNYRIDLVSLSNALNYNKHQQTEKDPIEIACNIFNLDRSKLLGYKRGYDYKNARAIISNHLYKHTNKTLQEVGGCLDKSHGAILSMLKHYDKQNKELIEMVERFNYEINR